MNLTYCDVAHIPHVIKEALRTNANIEGFRTNGNQAFGSIMPELIQHTEGGEITFVYGTNEIATKLDLKLPGISEFFTALQ